MSVWHGVCHVELAATFGMASVEIVALGEAGLNTTRTVSAG